jgi:hypothetical protein
VIGLSSSCISLLGIDYKMLEQTVFLKDILTLSLDDVKKSSANGNQSFKINELLKVQVEMSGSEYRKDPYTLMYSSYSDGSFWI